MGIDLVTWDMTKESEKDLFERLRYHYSSHEIMRFIEKRKFLKALNASTTHEELVGAVAYLAARLL